MKLKTSPLFYPLIISFISLFYFIDCSQENSALKLQKKLDFFEKVSERELSASESTLIGHIGTMEVVGNKVLIGDEMSKQVMLFDTSGSFIKKVSSIGDYPGGISYNVCGICYENGKTYVFDFVKANVFDENLIYSKSIILPYSLSEFCVVDGKVIYCEKLNPNRDAEIKSIEGEDTKTIKRIPLKFPRLASREKGFLINMGKGNLLLFIPSEFLLYMTNANGTFEKRNISFPEKFVMPSEDFRGDFGDIAERKKYDDKHQRSGVFSVFTQKSLIFIYWFEQRSREAYIDVYDYNLNHVISEIPIEDHFGKYANDDYFYGLKSPKMKNVEDIANPTLVKYRFRHELLDSLMKNLTMKK